MNFMNCQPKISEPNIHEIGVVHERPGTQVINEPDKPTTRTKFMLMFMNCHD